MKIILRAAFIAALSMSWGLSWAQVPFLDTVTLNVSFGCETSNGSTYEIWLYDDISPPKPWEDAQAFAASRELRDEQGHLATFESSAEEACVLEQAAGLGLGEEEQLWIGLVQDLYEGNTEPDDGWGWVTGEAFTYVNWATNEPNNAGGNEDHGTIGRYGYALTDGWNDEDPTRGTLFGLVIEYDVAALGEVVLECDGEECLIEIPSANPERNTIVLPDDQGGTATADIGVFLIEEDCSAIVPSRVNSRVVSFGPNSATITVPNYLCADEWILISSELDFSILEGVVEAEFEPGDFGITQNGCATEFTPANLNPLATDLLAYFPGSLRWGADDFAFPRSGTWMQDSTYSCDSSRGRMRGNQYFGVGLNFHLSGDVTNEVVLLTRDKIARLEEWVNDALFRQVVSSRDGILLLRTLQGVTRDIDSANYSLASLRMAYFDAFLGRTVFNTANAAGLNFEGEGISRSSNVRHMIDAYILPLTSLP